MDDLAGKIGELLGSPEGMERIRNLASMLGQSQSQPSEPAEETAPAPAPATSPLSGLGSLGNLGNLGGLGALGGLGNMDSDMLGTIMKLAPLLSSLNQEDNSTRLLHALRPLLGPERQKKLDEATKILQLMRMLPLLKSSGIF